MIGRGEPHWMRARYAGNDSDGRPFPAGASVLVWPNGKKLIGPAAQSAWSRAQSEKQAATSTARQGDI